MSWQNVLDNADQQRKTAESISLSPEDGIDVLYPELHNEELKGTFSNTTGSLLVPDLATSPCVVVDLYDWENPSDLINIYGVDLDFLRQLCDANQIAIAANLPPERYEKCEWLHDLLADKTTIFRSIRTPEYFNSLLKRHGESFENQLNAFSIQITRKLSSLTATDISTLCIIVDAAHPPKNLHDLSRILSMWITRIYSLDKNNGLRLLRLFSESPDIAAKDIRQWQILAVGPISGALGGIQRRPIDKILSAFPDMERSDALSNENFSFIEDVNKYISLLYFGIDDIQLTSSDFWKNLTPSGRNDILGALNDKSKRKDAMIAEIDFRNSIAECDDLDQIKENLDNYVEHARSAVNIAEHISGPGFIVTAPYFFFSGFPTFGIILGALGSANTTRLGTTLREKFISNFIPHVHAVRLARRRPGR